jgi:hypothetical protein
MRAQLGDVGEHEVMVLQYIRTHSLLLDTLDIIKSPLLASHG